MSEVQKAFIYQNVTSMTIVAAPIPEPGTYAMLFGSGVLVFVGFRRYARQI